MTGKSEVNYLLSGTGMQALQGYFKIFLKRAAQVACQQCQKNFSCLSLVSIPFHFSIMTYVHKRSSI